MNITVITSNQNRHNFLINKLSNICEKLYVIQERKEISDQNIQNIILSPK